MTRLQVSRGRKSNWPVAVGMGAAVGALTALVVGFSYGTAAACGMDDSCPEESTAYAVAGGLAVATTLAVGLFAKPDRWVDVTPAKPRVTIAPLPGRGVAVALSVRF